MTAFSYAQVILSVQCMSAGMNLSLKGEMAV